jgi:hypothetical protein
MGTDTEMSCSLECPEDFEFDAAPADTYKCKFAEGKFTPENFPKCFYSEKRFFRDNPESSHDLFLLLEKAEQQVQKSQAPPQSRVSAGRSLPIPTQTANKKREFNFNLF